MDPEVATLVSRLLAACYHRLVAGTAFLAMSLLFALVLRSDLLIRRWWILGGGVVGTGLIMQSARSLLYVKALADKTPTEVHPAVGVGNTVLLVGVLLMVFGPVLSLLWAEFRSPKQTAKTNG